LDKKDHVATLGDRGDVDRLRSTLGERVAHRKGCQSFQRQTKQHRTAVCAYDDRDGVCTSPTCEPLGGADE
jgi:hypothetical protein